jgi:hypothetical protein
MSLATVIRLQAPAARNDAEFPEFRSLKRGDVCARLPFA